MARTDFIEPLRRRLLELGCPMVQVRRLVREVADHHEDLKQAALSEGLSEANAEVRANTQLGDPVALAEHLMVMLLRSSWWGRHSIIGFCVLPLLAVPVLWALILFLGLGLVFGIFYALDKNQFQQAADNPGIFHYMLMVAHGADYLALALVTLLFCWLAQRSALRFKWTATACVICSLYALFSWIHITPHSLSLGITSAPHWIRFAIPLVTVAQFYAFQRRTVHCYHETVAV